MLMNYCMNCSNRKIYCHDSCEKYAEQKAQREEVNIKQKKYMDGRLHDGCLAPKRSRAKHYQLLRF